MPRGLSAIVGKDHILLNFEAEKITKRIEQALLARKYEEEKARDIAFHMTDWLDNLEELNGFCRKPEALNDQEIEDLLIPDFENPNPASSITAFWRSPAG